MFGSSSFIVVAGKLSKDPEMRYTPSGQAVTNLSIPANRQWTDSEGNTRKEVTWHNITVWGKVAELCNRYLKKGSIIQVIGRLSPDPTTGGPRIWTKQDGSPGASFEITAKEVTFLLTDPDRNQGGSEHDNLVLPLDEDDIPF